MKHLLITLPVNTSSAATGWWCRASCSRGSSCRPDLLTVEGYLTTTDPSPVGTPGRVYNVELASYRDGTDEAYRSYEERGEARMREYGYHVEYVLAAETAPAGRPRPDLVKISSFPDAEARAAFEADATHREIEEKLCPAATDHVVWLTAHTMT